MSQFDILQGIVEFDVQDCGVGFAEFDLQDSKLLYKC